LGRIRFIIAIARVQRLLLALGRIRFIIAIALIQRNAAQSILFFYWLIWSHKVELLSSLNFGEIISVLYNCSIPPKPLKTDTLSPEKKVI